MIGEGRGQVASQDVHDAVDSPLQGARNCALESREAQSAEEGEVCKVTAAAAAPSATRGHIVYSIFLVAGVCIANLWENEALQGGEMRLKFVQPGIIIYVNHSFLLLNFIIGLYLFSKRNNVSLLTTLCSFDLIQESLIDASGWSKTEALKKTTWLAFLYFVPNLFWAASLNYIPVSISVAMQQSQCGFVYLLGVCWNIIPAQRIKSIACAVCIIGVVLISIGTITGADDASTHDNAKGGDKNVLLGLLFAIVFPTTISFFSIFFKIYSKHCTTLERTCVLTGAIGVTNTMFIVPFILLQPVLGLGPVEFPATLDTVILVLYIGILAFFYNFFYMTGISVMGPLKSKYFCVKKRIEFKRRRLTNHSLMLSFPWCCIVLTNKYNL